MAIFKKYISISLCLVIIISAFAGIISLPVFAGTEATGKRDLEYGITYWYSDTGVSGYTSGTGTENDPYIITTAAELRHLARGDANSAGKYYKLGNDIVINETNTDSWYEGTGLKNWIKGTDDIYGVFSDTRNYREMGGDLFRGHFDGGGYTISGLYIDYNGTGRMSGFNTSRIYCGWGLFPLVYGATFENVKLKDVYIKSNITANTTDYQDAEFANAFTATTVSGEAVAYAKWSEAVTELSVDSIATGTTDLGIKVTNANAYPVKFTLDTDGEVTVSIFTASAENAYDKSVVWERTFDGNGDIGTLIEPAVINGGNKLYISVDGATASISEFVIGNAPTVRMIEKDVNNDNKFDIRDLVAIKKMAATSDKNWLGDIDDDGYIASAADSVEIKKGLLNVSLSKKKGDRILVWNDEFDGNGVNYSNFSYSNLEGANKFNTDSEENINVNDGKLNLSVSNYDGTTFKVPCRLITQDKVAFNRGYLEVRAKISATPGQWAGIWLSGEKGAEHFGEIDIMETDILGTSFKPNIHSWDTEGKRLGQLGNTVALYDYYSNNFNKTEYHIFSFEWDETELKFYVDGECYETLNISDVEKSEFPGETLFQKSYPFEGIFDQFYCVKFDNNIYDNLSADGVMPEFDIDYVRLYQKDGEQLKINGELVEK